MDDFDGAKETLEYPHNIKAHGFLELPRLVCAYCPLLKH